MSQRFDDNEILTVPESFELTDKEKHLLQGLYDWMERSKNTHWVLGEPLYG